MSKLLDRFAQRLTASPSSPLVSLPAQLRDTRSDKNFHGELAGLWGSQPRLLAALLAESLLRPLLFVTAHIPEADEAQDDLETFLEKSVEVFPAFETAQDQADATSEIACERLRLCQHCLDAAKKSDPLRIATSVTALMQPVATAEYLARQALSLSVKMEMDNGPEAMANWLIDHDFTRVDQVDVVGDFAARGGIVDIFSPGFDQPLRVEFFGDEIESLRRFDLDTQRSEQNINEVQLTGCRVEISTDEQTSLFNLLPENTLVVMEETGQIAEVAKLFLQRQDDPRGLFSAEAVFRHTGEFDLLWCNHFASGLFQEQPDKAHPSPARQQRDILRSAGWHLSRPQPGEVIPEPDQHPSAKRRGVPPHPSSQKMWEWTGQSIQRFEAQGVEGLTELLALANKQQVFLFCENAAEKQRMSEIIREQLEQKLPKNLHLPIGFVHRGFSLEAEGLLVISHHELFGQHQKRRRIRKIKSVQAIDSFTDLDKDDLVVHVNHGIGRFRGMKSLDKDGRQEEFLAIEFAAKAMIHVPASKIDLVHKYVGAGGVAKLSKLGSRSWEKQKQKVIEAVEDMAADLLELQAHRDVMKGIGYPADTAWQKEFERLFPYTDTPDQETANTAIKKDMQQLRPMDRLLCGDVGYGKTELSLRAAFKAVEHGKQVAVLVPTTVLAQQHYRTFSERLADFPFSVEVLSRFKTAGEAQKIIQAARLGQVDMLIGTHRILSDDVDFKDLGLVIIDEEQRFGVTHKERLKRMRKTVDVLTMTATPIPRTLHLSLLGIRDISSLTTPPLDRRSIVTEVCSYDRVRICQMILRELAREGQVYFVHNRVHNINSVADTVQRLVPDARVIVAHGQMPRHELEDMMLAFVQHEADVLVCTTIIESGLDIPNANTMIVNDADRFGLAQLHQLRGRVGRYKNRAYAYMLLPQKRTINQIAVKRLKAIEEYSQLGSGFRIAMRDLEIRGAGNILGIEQSGHIDAVGYELYCRLLAASVKRQKRSSEKPLTEKDDLQKEIDLEPATTPTLLDLNVSNFIPRRYIASDRQRLDVYRRLSAAQTQADLDQLASDLRDLFGKPPESVRDLLNLAEIRILAGKWQIKSIVEHEPSLIFTMHDMKPVEKLFADHAQKIRVRTDNTVYMKLPPNYFESPTTIMALLRNLLKAK